MPAKARDQTARDRGIRRRDEQGIEAAERCGQIDGRRLFSHRLCAHCRRSRTSADAREHVIEEVPQRGELIERDAVVSLERILLSDLAEELCLANAVDAEIGLEIRIEFHDLARIARLLDDKIDEKGFQFLRAVT
jgi:hypothetical protein